ncbi:MAG TPA: BamA/TamA family outer membrane protein [Candidatus Eisenbacteria bacterium]|jgi:outer membrane protein insertion porin family|nr:BamA/TamA family outer membrane protein [Candidatus Eisenbacteria bacterium]
MRGLPAPLASIRLFLALAVVVLAVLWAAPRSARAALDDEAELSFERETGKVEIVGNESVDKGRLKGLLRTKSASFWKPWTKHPLRQDYLRADAATIESFYRRTGYLYARVDSVVAHPTKDAKKSDVTFYVHEGPRATIKEILMTGLGPMSDREVREALLYQVGSPLELSTLEASRDSITYQYADRGYALASVSDSLRVDSTRVSVLYAIRPGPKIRMGTIEVEGTQKTKPSYVTRELLFEPGDVLLRSKLIQSQQRIYDSGLYSDVQMELGRVDSVTAASDIVVTVRERKMGWIDAGIGYGTIDQLRLTGQWGQRNIFRSSMRLVATGRLGVQIDTNPIHTHPGDRRIDLALTHPWPLGIRVQTTAGIYAEDEPIIQLTDQYPVQAIGASLVLSSPMFRYGRNAASYELRHVTQDSLLTQSTTSDSSYTTHRIALTTERDTRLNIFDPLNGSDVYGRVEFVAGTIPGTAQFTTSTLQATKYMRWRRVVLATRIRGGWIEPWRTTGRDTSKTEVPLELAQIPTEDRFRTGGASTVRGYYENELGTREVHTTTAAGADSVYSVIRGGQVQLLVSAELRFPLLWIFTGAAFFDGGNVWERPEDISTGNIFSFGNGAGYNDMRYSVGLGLRVGTPIGPIRLDYGWKLRTPRPDAPDVNPDPGLLHFSLGHAY